VSEYKRRRSKPLRFLSIPLSEDHPDWLELDRQVPADDLARQIRFLVEQLDLSELLETYTGVGGPLHPPAVLLAFVLYEMHHKRLSPAEWFQDSRDSLAGRWLLKGLRPCRAVLYRFRDHLPPALLLDCNRQVLLLARAEGHTSATRAALDGTFIAAYGSRHRLLTGPGLAHRLGLLAVALDSPEQTPRPAEPLAKATPRLAAAGAEHAPTAGLGASVCPEAAASTCATTACAALDGPDDATAASTGCPYWMAKSRAGRLRQQQRYRRAEQILQIRLIDHHKRQTQRPKAQRKSTEEVLISASEPEAVLGKDKCKVFRPLYNTQIAQDLDGPFVLGYGVYARANDTGLLPPVLERTKQLTGQQVQEAYADGSYATLGSLRYCQQEQVQLYAPPRGYGEENEAEKRQKHRKRGAAKKAKRYGKEKFKWQEQEQSYRCPQGHLLQLGLRSKGERRQEEDVVVQQYRCAKEHCQKCPQASQCTSRPDQGRTIKRMEGQELLDELAARMATPQAKGKYKRRSQTVELRYADQKSHRGLWGFRGYGQEKGESQVGLLVLVHNGLSLLQARAKRKQRAEAAPPRGQASGSLARPTRQADAAAPNGTAMPAVPSPKKASFSHCKVAEFDDWLRFD
jgi:transposase